MTPEDSGTGFNEHENGKLTWDIPYLNGHFDQVVKDIALAPKIDALNHG